VSALSTAIAESQVVVCCGTGGVGKTTTAAALGLQAAALGRRAVVATIDPAKRLADALGVPGGLGNDPVRLPIETSGSGGELWALMLDTARTFDGLVTANAANAEQAERILNNAFYRNVASSFSGTQDYMAAERLHSLHGDERFDVVIVDTPPTRNALDFLDAPGVISRFLDHPLFKMMMLPTRRGLRMLNVATQPIMRSIGRVVGGDVLADAIAFFQAFDGMETGFRRRAEEVLTLLRSDVTSYVLVASPRGDTVEEAAYFAERLRAAQLDVTALVVNRSTPTFGELLQRRPRRVAEAALFDNLAELHDAAAQERRHLGPLLEQLALDPGEASVWVPLLAGDVHDLDGLSTIRALLFD